MKYEKELRQLGVFQRKDVQELVGGNEHTAKNILYRYSDHGNEDDKQNKNLIIKIRRDYYAIRDPLPSWEVIGSNINDDAYLMFHAAMACHGFASKVPEIVHVASSRRFKNFDFPPKREYHWVNPRKNEGVINIKNRVRVTDVERTIADCLYDINRAGGFPELLRCLSKISTVEGNKLLMYLSNYESQFIYQKAGYILQYFYQKMGLNDYFFNYCRLRIGGNRNYNQLRISATREYYDERIVTSRRYLLDDYRVKCTAYQADWHLYTPEKLSLHLEDDWQNKNKTSINQLRSVDDTVTDIMDMF